MKRGFWNTLKLAWFKFHHKELLQIITGDFHYEKDFQLWRRKNRLTDDDILQKKNSIGQLESRPLISIIMPVYNPPIAYLQQAIASVIDQIYPNWELCIADDYSKDLEIRPLLEKFQAMDDRIKVVFRTQNGHISEASNSAITLATGEYIAFLDHDDLMTPDALYEVVVLINQHPDADLVYSDEDKLDLSGIPATPYFKPDWSPDNLLARMYTAHLSVYRRKIVEEIGALRVGFEGSQDHDLALRFVEQTKAIYHLPKILYHWRVHSGSVALNMDIKNYATDTGRKAIQEAIHRRGEPGTVEAIAGSKGGYRVRYSLKKNALISIIVPTRDLATILQNCLNSIFTKSSYEYFEVLQVDNCSEKQETKDVFQHWRDIEGDRYRVIECNIPFNYSKINNFAVGHAKGDYILFLNNDIEVISHDWLEGLLEQAQRKSIGAVGAKLLYPDGTIQHAGVAIGMGDLKTAGHLLHGYSKNNHGYFGNLSQITNYSALTAACLMCKKEKFIAVGGFDESLSVAYNDVDLCLKFREKHFNNVFLPHVCLYHHESKTRGYEDTQEKRNRLLLEAEILKNKWGSTLANDPYYNPNLSRKHGDFRIDLE